MFISVILYQQELFLSLNAETTLEPTTKNETLLLVKNTKLKITFTY